ncbi:nucleotidyltransferase [Synergistales bacterium]|nr:nucleotidyltransferase [Synergistales bacterium]
MDNIEIDGLRGAVSSLERGLAVFRQMDDSKVDIDLLEILRAGVIQTFEFTYELCWKYMRRWIAMNVGREYVDGVTRIELFRYAAENILIDDVLKWMEFHKARNLASHTYNEIIAKDVFQNAQEFLPYAKDFLQRIEKKI